MVEEYLLRREYAQQMYRELAPARRDQTQSALRDEHDDGRVAPSNLPWLNPSVIQKEAMDTGGESLVKGLSEMLDDMQNNGGYPKQVDNSAFTLG